jgi:hypothetical protein
VSEFRPDQSKASGLRSWCRDCENEDWAMRRAGVRSIAPLYTELEPRVLLCMCPIAVVARGQAGACECGFPIVMLMAPRLQEIMDQKWPEWRDQTVLTADRSHELALS